MHGAGDTLKRFFCTPDTLREYLTNGSPDPELRSYAKEPGFKQAFIDRLIRDGFEGLQCWYKATTMQLQYDCDKQLPDSADTVQVRSLLPRCSVITDADKV
jgi:soluble epoxide hydrolase/lipid-phosphate phosphatase